MGLFNFFRDKNTDSVQDSNGPTDKGQRNNDESISRVPEEASSREGTIRKVTLENGAVYEGEFREGKPNGKGVAYYPDGSSYEGSWSDGMRNGYGIAHIDRSGISPQDLKLLTELSIEQDAKKRAKIIKELGTNVRELMSQYERRDLLMDVYEGEWVNDQRSGFGKMTYKSQNIYGESYDIYEGLWSEDRQRGQGKKFLYKTGSTLEGEWNGDYLDSGRIEYVNGDVYEGDIIGDGPGGQGIMHYANGEVVEGNFIQESVSVYGTKHFVCGDVYEGLIMFGKPAGNGIIRFANGDVYEGDFFDGKFNGKGKMTYANGNVYIGQYEEGYRSGDGVMYYETAAYEGSWEDVTQTGSGTIVFFEDFEEVSGSWERDPFEYFSRNKK